MILLRSCMRAALAIKPQGQIPSKSLKICKYNSLLNSACKFPQVQSSFSIASKMYSRLPCSIGDPLEKVETPCLLICLDKLEQNIQKMNQMMQGFQHVGLRPHVKSHKCVALARMQIKNGAVGVCCQTLSEAEAMVEGGIEDILVSNQIIGKTKALRLAGLAHSAKISVCVDDAGNIEDLSQAANELGVHLDLLVEVNVGQDRCGVEPGEDVLCLVKKIQALSGVIFKGLHCYNGSNQHVRSHSDRKAAVDLVAEKAKKAIQILKDNGIECKYVTGGGTGTFPLEAGSGVFTEVQPVFMDADYNKNLDQEGKSVPEFEQSLYILATVQSVSGKDRAVLDAGLKAFSIDSGLPLVRSTGEDQVFHNGGDEHGIVKPRGDLNVKDSVWLIPGHCDPTVNMHNWLVGLRNGKVEYVWPVNGRGPGV